MLSMLSISTAIAAAIISIPLGLSPAPGKSLLAIAIQPTFVTNGACASGTCTVIAPFNKCCESKKWVMGSLDAEGGTGETGCDDEE